MFGGAEGKSNGGTADRDGHRYITTIPLGWTGDRLDDPEHMEALEEVRTFAETKGFDLLGGITARVNEEAPVEEMRWPSTTVLRNEQALEQARTVH